MATATKELADYGMEEEKDFECEWGKFRFRIPYALDDLSILSRRAALLNGVDEKMAGTEAVFMAHCKAVYDVLCVKSPRGFDFEKQRTWAPLAKMVREVMEWESSFRPAVETDQETDSPGQGQ